MKILRIFLKFIAVLLLLIVLVLALSIRPLDDSPYTSNLFYVKMLQRLDSLPMSEIDTMNPLSIDTHQVRIGWSKVNMTPQYPVPTAGYGKRAGKAIGVVHDSLYVRAFVFQKNNVQTAVVSCDLLIIPPEVTQQVQRDLPSINWQWQQVFIGATHTHNSMGAWGKRYVGELFAGKYDQKVVDLISKSIIQAIQQAQQNVEPSTISYDKINATEYVMNRLVHDEGTEDPWIRLLTFKKQSGKRAALVTFAAHSTTLSDTVMQLSRDYNGILVDKMERENGLDEAVFMSGCVGSMGPDEPKQLNDWQQAAFIADGMKNKIDDVINIDKSLNVNTLRMETIPLSMREPQWRIAENWCMRHWVWSRLYGDYDSEVKALRIGDILMVGLPCDFSGELMKPLEDYAASKGKKLIITSFNGGYVGYITEDSHYHLNKYETRMMNWFGPGNGEYFSEIVMKLIDKM